MKSVLNIIDNIILCSKVVKNVNKILEITRKNNEKKY